MAVGARTTTTYPTDAPGADSYRNSYVVPLRAAFIASTPIRASDITTLRNAVSTFNSHSHDSTDYQWIAEYGNNGPRTVVAADPRTSNAMSGGLTATLPTSGAVISATMMNEYVNACNAVRDHTHSIIDNTP